MLVMKRAAAVCSYALQKAATARSATASCRVMLGQAAFSLVVDNARQSAKGNVLGTAQLAGIMAAKQTSALIPLCHNIPLSKVGVEFELDPSRHAVHISAEALTVSNTGVEMEALTAASVAALTVYDMCKAVSKDIEITALRLEAKSGGRSGSFHRTPMMVRRRRELQAAMQAATPGRQRQLRKQLQRLQHPPHRAAWMSLTPLILLTASPHLHPAFHLLALARAKPGVSGNLPEAGLPGLVRRIVSALRGLGCPADLSPELPLPVGPACGHIPVWGNQMEDAQQPPAPFPQQAGAQALQWVAEWATTGFQELAAIPSLTNLSSLFHLCRVTQPAGWGPGVGVHFIKVDSRVLHGVCKQLGLTKETRAAFTSEPALSHHWARWFDTKKLRDKEFAFERTVDTGGVSVCVHYTRPLPPPPAPPPAASSSSTSSRPSAAAAAAHALGLPHIGRGIAETREILFDPDTQIGVGIDPGVTQAVSAASGVWDPQSGQLMADQLRRWKLTKGQVKHASGLNNARRDTERWLAPIKPHLQHLAASSAGTSLAANLKHITVTLATWDAVWKVYLDPKWSRQRLRLYGAQDRALEQFFNKLEEEVAEVSMERHGHAKQLVVFFGAATIGTGGGVQAQGRRPAAGHRTSRVSSAVNGQQPCEVELDKLSATRPAGWKPPAGQVEPRLVRPAWSQERGQPAPRSSQEATPTAASEPGPSTPQPAKRSKRTKAEPAAEPTKGKGKGKAAKAKPAPQPGRWLDRDCNAALNMQRIGESRWRPLELCYWPDQGALPAKDKEYPGLGYKRLRDKPPKAQQQQQQPNANVHERPAKLAPTQGTARCSTFQNQLRGREGSEPARVKHRSDSIATSSILQLQPGTVLPADGPRSQMDATHLLAQRALAIVDALVEQYPDVPDHEPLKREPAASVGLDQPAAVPGAAPTTPPPAQTATVCGASEQPSCSNGFIDVSSDESDGSSDGSDSDEEYADQATPIVKDLRDLYKLSYLQHMSAHQRP
ncbi:hypothetical protein QJQ45_004767 [Haematococcus lacustris]|nr:hypothetical protein QJQ45_004767 [Haematococcus lacustris]